MFYVSAGNQEARKQQDDKEDAKSNKRFEIEIPMFECSGIIEMIISFVHQLQIFQYSKKKERTNILP